MRIFSTIIALAVALVVGFIAPAILVLGYRWTVYPGLKEFDVGGLVLALLVGAVSAIVCVVSVFKRMRRRA